MERRDLLKYLIAAAALWPECIGAQQIRNKVWRIAILHPGSLVDAHRELYTLFQEELRRLGYQEGVNTVYDQRYADDRNERLPALVEELIASKPDVIVAVAPSAAIAAHRATSSIPIVMWGVGEPMALGLAASLAHPGGNVTGTSTMSDEAAAKSVELLHRLLPSAGRIAVLMSLNGSHPRLFRLMLAAADKIGLTLIPVMSPTPTELEQAFREMAEKKVEAVVVMIDVVREKIPQLALASKMPALYQQSAYADMGALLCYGASQKQIGRRTAYYVDKVLKGSHPADLPIEQPITFEMTVNLKAAAALHLTIPDTILAEADRIIE